MSGQFSPDPAPRKKPGPRKGDPRMVEAGRRGGAAVRAAHGSAFCQAIGRKGGETTRARYGPEYFVSIGKKGGDAVKHERGIDFYASIGRKGGSAPSRREP